MTSLSRAAVIAAGRRGRSKTAWPAGPPGDEDAAAHRADLLFQDEHHLVAAGPGTGHFGSGEQDRRADGRVAGRKGSSWAGVKMRMLAEWTGFSGREDEDSLRQVELGGDRLHPPIVEAAGGPAGRRAGFRRAAGR